MKIGIIGTRGIPNQYGGFEQFAEFVSPALTKRGHEVYVYNSSQHPYNEPTWEGVHIIKKYDPESWLGTSGQFIYDLNCIMDARNRNFDIILQLGYTSSSIWSFLFPQKATVITNMDGLEWKRTKYSRPVRAFLKRAEKWAAIHSHKLIADSKGIKEYLLKKYNKEARFIAYGAVPFKEPQESVLEQYNLTKYTYNLLIARMEPENNIESILKGHKMAKNSPVLLLIGNYNNQFGSFLKEKYEDNNIIFAGPVYDLSILNNLRYFSQLYFHGHSVGGTNPSLLEAMASKALVVAHDNIFNRTVLENDAFYFSGPDDVAGILNKSLKKSDFTAFVDNNYLKIIDYYSWDYITDLMEKYLSEALLERNRTPSNENY